MELLENIGMNIENGINNFFNSSFGKIVNFSIENGIRALLPNFIEDDVIEVKDTLIEEGLGEAVNKAIDKAVNLGKTAIGTITGNFESVSQAEMAVEKGGLIEGISDALDFVLDKVKDAGLLPKDIVKVIKNGKNVILNNVSSGVKNEFEIQSDKIEKLSSYNEKWREAFNNQDVSKMEQYMKKIKDILSNVMPVENIINEAREIENLHDLIQNNGYNFSLTDEQYELAKILL